MKKAIFYTIVAFVFMFSAVYTKNILVAFAAGLLADRALDAWASIGSSL